MSIMVAIEPSQVPRQYSPPLSAFLPGWAPQAAAVLLGSPAMVREIQLSQGQVALVDDEDYERLSQCKWWAQYDKKGDRFYARCHILGTKNAIRRMHRVVCNAPPEMVVDHINGDGLDNRRANLRVCTQAENVRNAKPRKGATSRFKGVSWHKTTRKWQARITSGGTLIHLGLFTTEEKAHDAYCNASEKYHGKFGRNPSENRMRETKL